MILSKAILPLLLTISAFGPSVMAQYSVNGKQYIAIGVGNGGAQAVTFPPLVPEIKNTDRAAAIWVFQAP